jgi:hypothetical protein
MNLIGPKVHGILDYVTVVAFLAAPTVLGLTGTPAVIAYALSGVHLGLTLLTAFPLGLLKVVPITVHGALELVVSVALPALPWVLKFSSEATARNFYVGAGGVIFVVWLITGYREPRKA